MSLHKLRYVALVCLLLFPISATMSESVLAATRPALHPRATIAGSLASGAHREVFGFALASSLSDPTVGYPSWDFSLLSTVAFFGLHVQDDGTFASDPGSTVWGSSQIPSLISVAHAHGTRVVLTVILQDFGTNTPHMCAGLSHGSTTVSRAVAEMKAKGVDGINVDYEGLNGSCGTGDSSWTRHAFTGFMSQLRSAMPAGSYLSVDTYASSASDPLGFFDISGLAHYTDSFFVMAYDLEYSNWSRPPASCGSFCLGPTSPLGAYKYNVAGTVSQYLAVVPPQQVVLGVPYYGRKACVGSGTPNADPTSAVVADTYLDASTESTDPAVQPGSYTTHRDANDPSGQERWDTWINTTLNCTRELYWDDVTSLGLKYDAVNGNNLGGLGIWNLNYGGGAAELWNELNLKFGTLNQWTALGGVLSGSAVITAPSAGRFDIFIRGSDNRLWHIFWNGTAWSSWESLGGVLTSAPAVTSWNGRLDVFVRGTDQGLWHRTSNGTTWTAWESLGGVMSADPSAVSWGAGRIDIFVRGTNNGIWHRASDGSSWTGWDSLGGIITSSPHAVSGGQSHLDVFATGTDRGLWRASWGGSSWAWSQLGGVLTSEPVPVASSTTRIDVFLRGTDSGLWQDTWNGTSWAWTSLGGVLTSGPAASSCAAGHLDVFMTGSDSAIWQRGFNGANWGAWRRQGGLWMQGTPTAACLPSSTTVELLHRDGSASLWQTNLTGS